MGDEGVPLVHAVDMSNPRRAQRRAYVIELKRGMPVRIGGGAVGLQLQNAAMAVRALARERGLLGDEATCVTVSGDGAEILGMFEQTGAAVLTFTRTM